MYPGLICLSLNANHRTGESSGEMRHQFALPTHPLHPSAGQPKDEEKKKERKEKSADDNFLPGCATYLSYHRLEVHQEYATRW
jgi:hypothetical protein